MQTRYDEWYLVFPHPYHGRLVELRGWPTSVNVINDGEIAFLYDLEWRDMDGKCGYYTLYKGVIDE